MKKTIIMWIVLTLICIGIGLVLAEENDDMDWADLPETSEDWEDADEGEEDTNQEEIPAEIEAEEIRPDQKTTVHIPAAETVYLYFVPEETNGYCFFSKCSEEDVDPVAYLFDENLVLLTASDDEDENSNFQLSYLLEKGKIYYLGCESASEDECEYPVILTKASGLMAVEETDLPEKWDHYMKLSVKAVATPGTALTYQWYQGLREETDNEIIDEQDYQLMDGEDREFVIVAKPAVGMVYCCKVSDDLGNDKTISFFLESDEEISIVDNADLEEPDEESDESEDVDLEEADEEEDLT